MAKTSWTVGVGIALSIVLTAAWAQSPPGVKGNVSVVPFEMLATNHMVVNAKINGKGPYRLIFDCGAPITLLGNKASETSGVVKKSAPRSILFAMRGEAKVKALEVGDLLAKDLPVIVLDHPTLTALGGFLGRPIDGIIGFTFFARYKTTIDYQKNEMTFEPVDYEVKDLMKELPTKLAGPKIERRRVLSPGGIIGMAVGEPGEGPSGVSIVSVLADSPANAAGLKPGDLLTTLDGRWITSVADAYAAAESLTPGKAVAVVVMRAGTEMSLMVTPRAGF
jgi:membrane-associated protease RseP (regulator of RpoE activity)